MYQLNDTIAAVSSPTASQRTIIRISGSHTIELLQRIFSGDITTRKANIAQGSIYIDDELKIDAKLYLFPLPHSYTGETLAEIHIHTNQSVTEALMARLLGSSALPVRIAGPGEFTARAYLNGKMDLAQAEAVGEIVACSNKFQLAAAEKLLAGRLSQTTAKAAAELMDCLSLIEAGLDFSGEDIEFITQNQAVKRLTKIKKALEHLLSGSISYESVIDLPAAGIAGAPNAGKSSLLNNLLGAERSIVSEYRKTTRDVLTGLLTLPHCRCVLFDCAGLTLVPSNVLDELAQQAAVEALRNASIVLFCVDVSKTNWAEDVLIRKLIEPKILIPVATKSDLLGKDDLASRLAELKKLFGADFSAVSVKSGDGAELLRETLDKKTIALTAAPAALPFSEGLQSPVAVTARHKWAVTEAIENITEAISELKTGNDEIAAMMLRDSYSAVSGIEQNIDERILEGIFSRFCIGK